MVRLEHPGDQSSCRAGRLAAAHGGEGSLAVVLTVISKVLKKTCRRNKRSDPGTFELLNDPSQLKFSLT
jgi:hypothetical protein